MEVNEAYKHKVGDRVVWSDVRDCQIVPQEGKIISIIGNIATVDHIRPDGTGRGLLIEKELWQLLGKEEPAPGG